MDSTNIKLLSIFFLSIIFLGLLINDKITHVYHRKIKNNLLIIYIISLVMPIRLSIVELSLTTPPGTFGGIIFLGVWHLLIILIFFLPSNKGKFRKGKSIHWLILFSFIVVGSYFNPYNANRTASLVAIYYILALLISFIIIDRRFNFNELLFAISKAFKIIVLIELVFVIAYPILKIDAATTLFYNDGSYNSIRSDEFGTMLRAIGTFPHPGPLSLIMNFIFAFFGANYFYGNKKRNSQIYLILSGFIIFFSFSRTNIAIAALVLLIFYIFTNVTNLYKLIRHAFIGVIIFSLIFYPIIFHTPVGSTLFLSENFSNMQTARLTYGYLGWKIFVENILMGIGINAHMTYLTEKLFVSEVGLTHGTTALFFETNPIHNTHLIILCELGLIGGLVWFYGFLSAFRTNFNALLKMNVFLLRPSNLSGAHNPFVISQMFALTVIIIYFLYAFTDWSTVHYYSLFFLFLAIMLSEKGRSEYFANIEK